MKGPFRTAHDGSVYIIGFIDVCSGMSFTYATQYKSDLLDVFVTFMAEIQSKLKVKPKNMTFRVDNDPTYKGDFKALLEVALRGRALVRKTNPLCVKRYSTRGKKIYTYTLPRGLCR